MPSLHCASPCELLKSNHHGHQLLQSTPSCSLVPNRTRSRSRRIAAPLRPSSSPRRPLRGSPTFALHQRLPAIGALSVVGSLCPLSVKDPQCAYHCRFQASDVNLRRPSSLWQTMPARTRRLRQSKRLNCGACGHDCCTHFDRHASQLRSSCASSANDAPIQKVRTLFGTFATSRAVPENKIAPLTRLRGASALSPRVDEAHAYLPLHSTAPHSLVPCGCSTANLRIGT